MWFQRGIFLQLKLGTARSKLKFTAEDAEDRRGKDKLVFSLRFSASSAVEKELEFTTGGLALHDKPAAYQLVGAVTAHQGEDG